MDLLENNHIPCYKKSKGPGEYMNLYMGYSVYGEDIYVAERDYEKASSLLNELMAKEAAESTESEEATVTINSGSLDASDSSDDYHVPFYRKPQIIARLIIILYIATIVMSVIINKLQK